VFGRLPPVCLDAAAERVLPDIAATRQTYTLARRREFALSVESADMGSRSRETNANERQDSTRSLASAVFLSGSRNSVTIIG